MTLRPQPNRGANNRSGPVGGPSAYVVGSRACHSPVGGQPEGLSRMRCAEQVGKPNLKQIHLGNDIRIISHILSYMTTTNDSELYETGTQDDSNYYHARVTVDILNPRYAQFAKERTIEHILVRENADVDCKQPHIHLMCKTLHNNDQGFRREFKGDSKVDGWFPKLTGNGQYSIKKANRTGYNYVCKGTGPDWDTGKPEVLSTTFTEDEIKEFHRMVWNHINREKINLTKEAETDENLQPKVKKIRKKNFYEEVVDELTTAYPDRCFNKHKDASFLTKYILRKMGARGRALDDLIFKRTFYAVYNGLKKDTECQERHDSHYEHLLTHDWC